MQLTRADLLDVTAFYDPAGGKRNAVLKRMGARAAIVVVGQTRWGHVLALHAWAKRATTTVQMTEVLAANRRWQPRVFGCESNGMQEHQGTNIYEEARRLGEVFPMRLVDQPTNVEKTYRIRTILQPVIAAGRLIVPAAFYELRSELETFPSCLTFDLVDALASAVALLPRRTTADVDAAQDAALADYLRELGHDRAAVAAMVGEHAA